jgi:hypothetical protein
VHVQVWHLEAGHHQTGARSVPLVHLRGADALGHGHQVGEQLVLGVEPLVDLLAGHHQRVTAGDGPDAEKGDRDVVGPDEPAGQLAGDDLGEERGHATSLSHAAAAISEGG